MAMEGEGGGHGGTCRALSEVTKSIAWGRVREVAVAGLERRYLARCVAHVLEGFGHGWTEIGLWTRDERMNEKGPDRKSRWSLPSVSCDVFVKKVIVRKKEWHS